MSVMPRSQTRIELILKSALVNENIPFEEQRRIYEKGQLYPKYVVDFLIECNGKTLVVECDGFSYHSSDYDVDKSILRDSWLTKNGYGKVLHFNTYQIKFELEKVILNIKSELNLISVSNDKLKFKGKRIRDSFIINVESDVLHSVDVFYDMAQIGEKVYIVYKYRDNTAKYTSEIRRNFYKNVPIKSGGDFALLVVLSGLKKSANITVYSRWEWIVAYFNGLYKSDKNDPVLNECKRVLTRHNYLFKYLNCARDASFYENPQDERFIFKELRYELNEILKEKEFISDNQFLKYKLIRGKK